MAAIKVTTAAKVAVKYLRARCGDYELLDENRAVVKAIDGYVPDIMCPGGRGYGDYVIMTVGADGVIADWRVDLSSFERKEDE